MGNFHVYKAKNIFMTTICKLTIGCCSSTVLSRSPCSQNSAATDKATWKVNKILVYIKKQLLIYSVYLPLTLLCTSQGLVMADKSHAVIIIALKSRTFRGSEKSKRTKKELCLHSGFTHMTISFLVVSRDMKSTHFFSFSYVCERSTIFWNMVLFLPRHDSQHNLRSLHRSKRKSVNKWEAALTWNTEPSPWRWWRCPWGESRVPPVACWGSGRCSVTAGETGGERDKVGWDRDFTRVSDCSPPCLFFLTSSANRNFPNSRWCRSKMEEPCSLARGLPDLLV